MYVSCKLEIVGKKVKKNLSFIDTHNPSHQNGSYSLKACDPCMLECKKIDKRINGRELSDIKDEEVAHILSPFTK